MSIDTDRAMAELSRGGATMPDDAAEQVAALDEMVARHERIAPIAAGLVTSDPLLPYTSAITIAGDMLSMERSQQWVLDGTETFATALPYVGSFARFQFILWGLAEGHTTPEDIYPDLAEHWRGSDPDDTDERAIALWRAARVAHGSIILDDPDKPLPPGRTIRLYRGQDEGAPFGLSWTTDIAIAEKFARGAATRQSNRGGIVIVTSIPRERAMAYITGRDESEVIVDPADVQPDPKNPRGMGGIR